MTGLLTSPLPFGATPLDPHEASGLRKKHITTLGELNEFEQHNISLAMQWLAKSRKKDVLNISFVMELHKRMFSEVWQWAGKQRQSDKNIGVAWSQIPEMLSQLIKDVNYWIENKTFGWDEIGCRLHHRLVAIHVFSNGNGRHARLYTDHVLESNSQIPFSWGIHQKNKEKTRKSYIEALRDADRKDYEKLLRFVRS